MGHSHLGHLGNSPTQFISPFYQSRLSLWLISLSAWLISLVRKLAMGIAGALGYPSAQARFTRCALTALAH